MTPDRRIVARTKAVLEDRRRMSEGIQDRRLRQLYERLPEIEEIDSSLRLLGIEIARSALLPDGAEKIRQIRERSAELRRSRARILEKSGLKDPVSLSCPDCGDTGFMQDGRFCTCFKKIYVAETLRWLSEKLPAGSGDFASFNPDLFSDEWDAEMDSSPRKSAEIAVKDCSQFAETFDRSGENLFLWGPASCGKTYIAGAIARRAAERGFSVDYESAYTLCSNFEAQRFGRGTEDTEAAVKAYGDADLLIIDDLGCEMSTSATDPVLYNLINTRYSGGKSTVILSELTRSKLSERYIPQIVGRIWDDYHMIVFMSGIERS